MTKKALVVGIDNYDSMGSLTGCTNDAEEIAKRLEFHGDQDESANFDVRLLTGAVTTSVLKDEIKQLFSENAETVVFYYAGHGVFDEASDFGFIASKNGDADNYGVNLSTITKLAASAYPKITSTVIILDCCHSGQIADGSELLGERFATIGTGVTILTASTQEQLAFETPDGKHGLFTSILLDGLDGAAADILGDITPASLYSHVDRTLGSFEQRPLYKANVKAFTSLRRVNTEISKRDLCMLPSLFKVGSHSYPLGPHCEPMKDRGKELGEKTKHIEFDPVEHEKYKFLQKLRNNRIVAPDNEKDMYWEAMNGWSGDETGLGSCTLTKLGEHYLFLALKGKFGKPREEWE